MVHVLTSLVASHLIWESACSPRPSLKLVRLLLLLSTARIVPHKHWHHSRRKLISKFHTPHSKHRNNCAKNFMSQLITPSTQHPPVLPPLPAPLHPPWLQLTWAMAEEATSGLIPFSLAVFATMCRCRAITHPLPGLDSIAAGYTALCPWGPHTPASINCRARLDHFHKQT